jgi:hypothetical protein
VVDLVKPLAKLMAGSENIDSPQYDNYSQDNAEVFAGQKIFHK